MKLKKSSAASTSSTLPGTLVPLLLALAGLAAAAALVWFTLFSHSNQRYQQDMAQAYAGQQLAALNRTLEKLDADLTAAAANPQIQVALRQGGSPTLQRLMRYMYADNLAIYTHLIGQAKSLESGEAPLSFAAIDMIRRAERNMPVPAEAHRVNGAWRLYTVKPLRASTNAPIGGTLMAVFELPRITTSLPALPDNSGQVRLIQQFPGAPEQVLHEQGSGEGTVIRLPSDNPAWFIEFRAGSALSAGLINPLLLFAAVVLALAGLLAGLLWLHRQWASTLAADAETLTQLTLGHKAAGLHLGPLEPVGASIMQLARRTGQTLGANPERAKTEPDRPAAKVSKPAPMIDDDILDIDILDEDPFAMAAPSDQAALAIPQLPEEIFRAYDIRGVAGKTLTEEGVYWLGRAIGSESVTAGQSVISVGRDGRLSGPTLVEQLIQGLMDTGCHVIDLGMVPTPVVYFATHTLESSSGVMLTGSHNPADYNGLKIVIAGQTLSEDRIKALHTRLKQQDLISGQGSREQRDVLPAYQQRIVEDVALARPLKVVIDCGNGVAGVIAQSLLEELGCMVTPLHCEVDGNFPNHHPDPGKLENLSDLIAEVKRQQADIGIAFDGDGDRLGVITSDGELIYPDRLLMLLAEDVVTRHPGADIVFDVKCTRRLPSLISKLGGRPVMWKSGHSMIKAKMQEIGALLGGEMSGHIFFKERWYGFDDGLYSACRLLEILSVQPDNLSSAALMAKYTSGLTTPEINLSAGELRKFEIIEALMTEADWGQGKLTTLDGIRVDYPHGWGLVRASNTTPMLVLRFEANKPEALDVVQQVFRDQLATVAPDLEITF
ncbi:MAG TPA: phosphomannomutase/phosphoglucomutase [Pseudomonas xinjiangensis]|uniref:phosphomannomutase n=2 Tax=root TaxID=1 RepID=A0A7V1BM94_9GAMM|nr:phosphomannomutase/phosphoglucomutase [Halopseudomonas xinjiangensis]HEC47046.1 phosphomannomutase/phosphoglucomutase [Halopseudomonas xinjiangensis]